MRLLAAFGAAVFLLMASPAWAQKGYGKPVRSLGGRIMAVGDSITWGANYNGGYRGFLEERLTAGRYGFQFVGGVTDNSDRLRYPGHEGHGGWTILDLADGRADQPSAGCLTDWMKAYKPDTVLLMAGTNDNPFEDAGTRSAKYEHLLDRVFAANPKARVVLASIPKSDCQHTGRTGAEAMAYQVVKNVVAGRKARGFRVAFADTYTSFDADQDLSDDYHPNENGYRKIAEAFFAALKSG